MVVFPNAKINLGLNVVSRREDGYHNIESVLFPVPFYDVLEVTDAVHKSDKNINLHLYGMPYDGKLNLVEKAYFRLASEFDLPSVDVYLKKNIPFAAGLGGGSSDAAFMLRLLVEKYSLPVTPSELHRFAADIGADCPFFLYDKPLYVSGTGTVLSDVSVNLRGMSIVIVKPSVAISTAEAYSGVIPSDSDYNIKDILRRPPSLWREMLKNDFENSLFQKHPLLSHIKEELYKLGAVYASMSGSGSSIFGIYEEDSGVKSAFREKEGIDSISIFRIF
ncbi:MAG: 4-(cytidine 5'-diphospho)-2-C-methyl-D-erythritol kinase [Bacteroidales bacterium]